MKPLLSVVLLLSLARFCAAQEEAVSSRTAEKISGEWGMAVDPPTSAKDQLTTFCTVGPSPGWHGQRNPFWDAEIKSSRRTWRQP
ncbi:hypothetical protein GC173_07625 [bacterium]|nr:hypothetical protein [bacterium]